MFYIEKDNKIVLADENYQRLKNTLEFMPEYKNFCIFETDKNILMLDEKYYFEDDEDYIEKNAALEKEKERQTILKMLDELDKKRIRAVCETEMKDENTTWLEYYNSQIAELRKNLNLLLE